MENNKSVNLCQKRGSIEENCCEIAIIVQARCGSTRMPAKVIKPFNEEECLLEMLIDKLKKIDNSKIIIATSVDPNNNPIEDICNRLSVNCFRGSENDVLKRFIDAANKFNCSKIIRICSDNPFLELDSLKRLAKCASERHDMDYISFKIGEKPSIQTHYGFWAEYVTIEGLKKVQSLTNESLYHEHVTNYIYSHADQFNIDWLETPQILLERNKLRLTIDTENDFMMAQQIYKEITKHKQYPTIEDVVDYLDNHSDYYNLMENEIIKNSK